MPANEYMERAMKALQYDEITELLKAFAVTDGGAKLCKKIMPMTDPAEIQNSLKNTDDALIYILKGGIPPITAINDITISVQRAGAGGVLSASELLEAAKVLKTARNLIAYFDEYEFDSSLNYAVGDLKANKYLEEKISGTILSEDEIADNASAELFDIRRKIKTTSQKIRDDLQKMIHSATVQKILQDPIITVRSERFVIPVKAEHKNEIPGLIHDTSSSGATVFIEPLSVLEANNEIKLLKQKEQAEIERILYELSAETATFGEELKDNYHSIAELDFIFAKAKLARRQKAVMPTVNTEGQIRLIKARHPLIDENTVVPVDLSLGEEYSTLVITGPNTGGKTVALKTTGLLTLMAQSGLLIPAAENSKIGIFETVYADIGDEQSIKQSLSTFSAHMTYIVKIAELADSASLILLDELGAGTDPVEGAALAVSILEYIAKFGAKIAATTHYTELKLYALETPGVQNASCEFDIETLRPTYRLITGVPGRSNAFAIASRLGLVTEIVDKAKLFITEENSRFENVIDSLEKNRKALENERETARKKREEADLILKNAKKLRDELDEKAKLEREKLLSSLRDEIENSRNEINKKLAELSELRRRIDAEDFKEKLSKNEVELRTAINALESKVDKGNTKKKNAPVKPNSLKVGDTVKITQWGKDATVLSLPDKNNNVLIQAGVITTRININKLETAEEKKPEKSAPPAYSRGISSKQIVTELDIRGFNALEAEDDVGRFIDDAVLSGLATVSIIHGKGTGVLRTAVHSMLKKNKSVRSFRLGVYGEGETGVTIIELK